MSSKIELVESNSGIKEVAAVGWAINSSFDSNPTSCSRHSGSAGQSLPFLCTLILCLGTLLMGTPHPQPYTTLLC
jgi:hypothetical protein